MKARRLLWLVVILVAVSAVAWARAYVIGASGYSSNGASVGAWRWLRSPGHTATWTFSATELQGMKKVYINFSPLVTNGADGGSGYDTKVMYTICGAKTYDGTISVVNPFRPTDPENSGGAGYQCYGHSAQIPISAYKGARTITVTIAYPFPNGRHVAVSSNCMFIGYSK
jgi:hypothetical protein